MFLHLEQASGDLTECMDTAISHKALYYLTGNHGTNGRGTILSLAPSVAEVDKSDFSWLGPRRSRSSDGGHSGSPSHVTSTRMLK